MRYIALTTGELAKVDDRDYKRVRKYRWGKKRMHGDSWYARSTTDPRIWMHRLITGAPPGFDVDHRDHDTLNNQRRNLRVVTKSQNQQNRLGANRNSSTGVRGVQYIPTLASPYRAYANVDKHTYYFGHYQTLRQAEVAVIAGRKRLMTNVGKEKARVKRS